MAELWYEVREIPDLTLNKYQSLSDTGVEGVLLRHSSFLRQWHGICVEASASLHLLYLYLPNEVSGRRLKLYLAMQGDAGVLDELRILLPVSPLSSFYVFTPTNAPDAQFTAGATITKRERVADIYHPLADELLRVHYVPRFETDQSARLHDLWSTMNAIASSHSGGERVGFRVDLFPLTEHGETRAALAPVLRVLRGDQSVKLTSDTPDIKTDDMARQICDVVEDWIEDVETSPCYRMNVYGFASTDFHAKLMLIAAGSEALLSGDYEVTPIRFDSTGYLTVRSRFADGPFDYCRYPGNAALPQWPSTYTLEQVEPFFRLPALYDGEGIEIPKESTSISQDEGILLGRDVFSHEVNFPVGDLPRHALFTGMPGSGKTNTMLHMATELHGRGIPFLILEPAKKEYRSLLLRNDMKDVYLFSPHLCSNFPLRVNPLEFPIGVRLSEHIEALLEVFEGSFELQGSTRKFLSSAIERSYRDLGWDVEDVNAGGSDRSFPTLSDVQDRLAIEIDESDYDAELKGNLRSFLQVRLGGLLERDAGELFGACISTIEPSCWIKESAIIELEVLGEHAKNFLVLLLCHYVFETLRADPKGGVDESERLMPTRHVVFIEEAHNIIAPTTLQPGGDTVDPKIAATSYIVKMLAEVRALREAIIIADQLPTALAPEVTKNTGLKVVHRLGAADDREQVGAAIAASSVQLEQMATLSTGQAFVFHEHTMRPFQVSIEKWGGAEVALDASDDHLLFEYCRGRKQTQESVLYALKNYMLGPLNAALKKLVSVSDHAKLLATHTDMRLRDCLRVREESEAAISAITLAMHKFQSMSSLLELSESTDERVLGLAAMIEETAKGGYEDALGIRRTIEEVIDGHLSR
ncbi:MAG: ATP-binding protein [Atopobiaceae bacterium]|nr:ATP-binding protein [Atopobiaceae bacterium]